MAGIDLPTLRELAGHANIQMTMRYVHPTPEEKREAVRKLERFNIQRVLIPLRRKGQSERRRSRDGSSLSGKTPEIRSFGSSSSRIKIDRVS